MKRYLLAILFVVLAIIPVFSLLHPGLPLTHDGQDHVARIANFYQNLVGGNIVPRWAGNLNWGYGHPILEFLYPLPSYIASFFHLTGFSLVDSTKIVFTLGVILSLIFMYLWLSEFLGKASALFGAVLYTYAPYRFVDLYVRGDIGEHLAFAFLPLVLYFIFKLYKKSEIKYSLLGALSLTCLILAHNAIALITVPFILFYCLYLVWLSKFNRSLIINLLSLIILGFGLSAFFWIPGLLDGKYTLRDIVTKGGYANSFVDAKSLIYGKWSYGGTGEFTVQLGVFQWLSLIFSFGLIYKLLKHKDQQFWLILGLIIYTLMGIFLMLPISNFIWQRVILLQNFQFPWRFLAIPVFSTAVLGAYSISLFPKKLIIYLTVISIIVILFISRNYIKPKDYLYHPESFYTGVYNGTTDTGESAPIWSVRFMEHRPKAHLEVIDGIAQIKELYRSTTYHKYQINAYKETLFEENTLYFPGWEIKANGVVLNLEFQNMNYRGVMLFHLPKGDYIIEVRYKETKLRQTADMISLISLIVLVGFGGYRFVKK